jgi:2-polyprenyl-3-methyl-5-hydroxy-6-metoxy-1,4-benzoquinol methylase
VNYVAYLHEWARDKRDGSYDTVISTDCLEHDKHWKETLAAMIRLLKNGGLMAWTCAGEGRAEHGTSRINPEASPGTHDYYGNITPEMVRQQIFAPEDVFSAWDFNCCTNTMGPGLDTRFWGVKKQGVEA